VARSTWNTERAHGSRRTVPVPRIRDMQGSGQDAPRGPEGEGAQLLGPHHAVPRTALRVPGDSFGTFHVEQGGAGWAGCRPRGTLANCLFHVEHALPLPRSRSPGLPDERGEDRVPRETPKLAPTRPGMKGIPVTGRRSTWNKGAPAPAGPKPLRRRHRCFTWNTGAAGTRPGTGPGWTFHVEHRPPTAEAFRCWRPDDPRSCSTWNMGTVALPVGPDVAGVSTPMTGIGVWSGLGHPTETSHSRMREP